ncbi:hypothetical protein POUND7_007543 [Theobroma cacao]
MVNLKCLVLFIKLVNVCKS